MSESFESFWTRTGMDLDTPKDAAMYAWDVQQQRLNVCNDLIAMYQNGHKGGCYACETVGETNIKLEAELAALEKASQEFFAKEMGGAVEAYAAKNRLRQMAHKESHDVL